MKSFEFRVRQFDYFFFWHVEKKIMFENPFNIIKPDLKQTAKESCNFPLYIPNHLRYCLEHWYKTKLQFKITKIFFWGDATFCLRTNNNCFEKYNKIKKRSLLHVFCFYIKRCIKWYNTFVLSSKMHLFI